VRKERRVAEREEKRAKAAEEKKAAASAAKEQRAAERAKAKEASSPEPPSFRLPAVIKPQENLATAKKPCRKPEACRTAPPRRRGFCF
jgi:hypothetical protein